MKIFGKFPSRCLKIIYSAVCLTGWQFIVGGSFNKYIRGIYKKQIMHPAFIMLSKLTYSSKIPATGGPAIKIK